MSAPSSYTVADYGAMIVDPVRMDRYVRALEQAVRPDAVVVDIGTGTGIFALLSSRLPEAEFLAWGWRVPFLLSTLLIGIGMFVRLRLLETPSFTQEIARQGPPAAPLLEVFRLHPRQVLVGMGMRFATSEA